MRQWVSKIIMSVAVVAGLFGLCGSTSAYADTVEFQDNFSSYAINQCPGYTDGMTFGQWKTVFAGYGCVAVSSDGLQGNGLTVRPRAVTASWDTSSALVTGPEMWQPFIYSGAVKTVSQLRQNSAPNAWETARIVWNYTDNDHFYYFMPKANGWELGKRDPAYPWGQRYLATGSSPVYPLADWKQFSIEQNNNTIIVKNNGQTVTTFTDTERPYMHGKVGVYVVDSEVKFDSVQLIKPDVPFSLSPGRQIPDTLHGVTTESIGDMPSLVQSLDLHNKTPMTRVVFQQDTTPATYTTAIQQIRQKSYVMGELLDSTALAGVTADQYKTRTRNFVNQFKNNIDIYEIGNELNGEWVGSGPAEINAKLQAAYDVVEKEYASYNLRSAITLSYWPSSDCYAQPWENTIDYAQTIPAEVRNGVDYILLSFYETTCEPRAYPTNQDFIAVFDQLKTIFPNAKIGMGEIGAQNSPSLIEKQRVANRYYGMHSALRSALGQRYVGGYFWWYYYQDAVPYNKTNTLWSTIEANFNSY